MLNSLKENILKNPPIIEDGMILSKNPPHAITISHLKECHSGTVTSEYYFAARYFDLISDEEAKLMISELRKLQVTDENAPNFGCLRWYREEDFVNDTNGAFFILLPLALAYKLFPEKMTEEEKEDILFLLKNGAYWFSSETKKSLHYCNKIMSDGAMLALIANITGECKKDCDEFWTKWHDYADNYGWGWGENTSDCYSAIMLNALNVVVLACEGELREKAEKRREMLLDYISFHDGREFVPSIRTYNYEAKASYGGSIYRTFHTSDHIGGFSDNVKYIDVLHAVLIEKSGAKWIEKDRNRNTRNERLFGNSYAYTWESDKLRLGSVSHFPVMPCSYQSQSFAPNGKPITYGLGWQSTPVSAMVDDRIFFLRTRTQVGENTHYHPLLGKTHSGHAFNRLFEDGNITVFSTISAQTDNIAIVTRYANKLANTASAIYDEWCAPNGKVSEAEINGRKWFIIKGDEKAIAVCPLVGIYAGKNDRAPMKTTVGESGIFTTVTTTLYEGENKLLFAPRVESSWVVVALENPEKAEEYLGKIEITDEVLPNFEITLHSPYKKRKITCICEGKTTELLIDPVNQIDY